MNAKTVAIDLGIPIHVVYAKCRTLGITKKKVKAVHNEVWSYEITPDEYEKIRSGTFYYLISMKVGMLSHEVQYLAERLDITDEERIIRACELHKTGEYTIKGISLRLRS